MSTDAYVEEEEKEPDWLAEDAVVICVSVPVTVAVVPDAEFVKLKEADPAPPATASSSASVSSMVISMSCPRLVEWSHLQDRKTTACSASLLP
jgi:hypothetical protein